MKPIRSVSRLAIPALAIALLLGTLSVSAAGPRVRAIHASPDAPAVDVWVDGSRAFANASFGGTTPYASLSAGEHQITVVPAGTTEPAVISATLSLAADQDYSIVAVGDLANIEPLVLEDNNSAPAAGKAHVRFVHASPDAPAVDIAVKGGPVLFSNIAFKGTGNYLPADAGTYDLEVRLAGTDSVALAVPGVRLEDGAVYTVFAMGRAAGNPALAAVLSVDRPAQQGAAPGTLPVTGGEFPLIMAALILGSFLLLAGGSLQLAPRRVRRD